MGQGDQGVGRQGRLIPLSERFDPNGGVLSGNGGTTTSRDDVVQHCRTVNGYQDVIRGYDVTYRYNGHDTTIRMPYDPGPNVQVTVGAAR